MKLLVVALVLLGACTQHAYVPFSLPPPSKTAQVGTQSLLVFLPDSSEQTYPTLLQGLIRAGYSLPELSAHPKGQAVAFSTKPKTVAGVAGLSLQVVIDPLTPTTRLMYLGQPVLGDTLVAWTVVTFMAKYVPVDSLGQQEHDSRKWRWIYAGKPTGDLPTQAFWEDMEKAALECFPGARIGYQ